ncbi:hypothetical protein VHEMI04062 [[Torrubiella] hemipterigena]|uniref:phosphoserine phosphatase n=1 Tax=[Torrubiella] hemipterigena TaxID=1531966 RepID=A0A0A1TD40_9HYPO|nr:hypothetical protein VHEMI04062 [[Torrubiella] hemipterigena]
MSATVQTRRGERPQLAETMRSNSYLNDHHQYRKPQILEPHPGIDAVVENESLGRLSPKPVLAFRGVPSEEHPSTVVESGVSHSYSHPYCSPVAGSKSDRLIATLIYNGGKYAATRASGSASPPASAEVLPANLAPTQNIDSFPLEPPTQESEQQLDHLYGSYVSPLCVTSFLHLMSSFPLPPNSEEPHSSHRCLDNQENPRVVELTLSPAPSPDFLSLAELRKHEMIYRFEREWNVDVILQHDVLWRRHPRLVVFDMDSTLITQEVIDLLAEELEGDAEISTKVAEITHRAMMGELEFEASFRQRLALLKDLPEDIFTKLRSTLEVTNGVPQLLKAFKRLGIKTAVLSGGFQPLTSWLAGQLGLDYAYANEVVIEDGKLTGEARGIIVGKERKRDLLLEIAKKENIDLSQAVAVGDGANDLFMLNTASLGVAWNAKPRVQMEAGARLNGDSLLDLLYLFGFTREEVDMLTE